MKQDNSKKEQVDIFNSDLCLNLMRAIGSDEMGIQEKSVIIKKAFQTPIFKNQFRNPSNMRFRENTMPSTKNSSQMAV